MPKPVVTIGIPFYNAEEYLSDAIKSIFAQTFQDWELILVDDGSTDSSLEIANSIKDPRVRVISDGQNKKLPARLNQIAKEARGKYIARMDADDLCSPSRIEKQLELFAEDPSLDVVGTGMIYLDENDVPLGCYIAPPKHSEICSQPYRTFRLGHGTTIAKKSWLQKNRYSESTPLAQDFNLWLRTYKHSKFGNVPEALYYYRREYSFNHKKCFKDRRVCAKFLFKYYRERNGLSTAVYAALMQYIKLTAGLLICVIWSKRKLIERRYKPISSEEKQFYEQEIRNVKEVQLPIRSWS